VCTYEAREVGDLILIDIYRII